MNEEITREEQATAMGWLPKEQFRGNPDNWVDADTYIQRGETFIPFMKAENGRLHAEIDAVKTRDAEKDRRIKELESGMEEMRKFVATASIADAKERRRALIGELAQAREANDIDREAELTAQIGEVATAIKEKETAPRTNADPPRIPLDPIVKEFVDANQSWLGPDVRRSALFNGIVSEKMAQLNGRPATDAEKRTFLADAKAEADRILSPPASRQEGKVDGARPSSRSSEGGSSSTGKSYSDLPPDAKAACDRQGERLIGKSYKTREDWRKVYCQIYYAE